MTATSTALRTIRVELSANPYPVVIGGGALRQLGEQIRAQGIKAGTKVLVVTNPVVQEHYGDVALNSLRDAGFDAHTLVLEAGEEQKTPATVAGVFWSSPASITRSPAANPAALRLSSAMAP